MRRVAILIILLAAAAWTTGAVWRRANLPKRPHGIVMWVIDTCRADRLGVYDPSLQTTPFLVGLARESVVFEHCFSSAPWTKPAMAAMLTGRDPLDLGVWGLSDRLDDDAVTLAESLSAAGYRTAGFSTNPIVGAFSNYTQGFEEFAEWWQVVPNPRLEAATSGSAAALLEQVLPWLDAHASQPFFLFIHSMDPHEEYRPAPQYLRRFAEPGLEARYREAWNALKVSQPQQIANHCSAATFASAGVDADWFVAYGRQLYDADIFATDVAIERLWSHLGALGLTEQTVFLVTADHGEEFMEHGGTSHGFSLYNELLRVPLILRAPGQVAEGTRITRPVRSIDIAPTILGLVGLAPETSTGGASLLASTARENPSASPLFAYKNEGPAGSSDLFRIGTARSVIDWPWKLIQNGRLPAERSFPAQELFRLDSDWGEHENVAESEPGLVAHLATLLDANETRATRARSGQTPPTVDPKTRERLRQLGYDNAPPSRLN